MSERLDVGLLAQFLTQSTAVFPVHAFPSSHTHTWSYLIFVIFYMTATCSCHLISSLFSRISLGCYSLGILFFCFFNEWQEIGRYVSQRQESVLTKY